MARICMIFLLLSVVVSSSAQSKTGKKGEPMTAAGQGLQMNTIHAIILKSTTALYPYVLLNDGTIYSRMDVSPHDFDASRSKKLTPKKWGTWVTRGESYFVRFGVGKEQEWKTWYATRPATKGEIIEGIYKCVGGFGGSNVHRFNTLILRKDGSFTWRYFYRSNQKFIPHNTDKEIEGTYYLDDYTIEFKYDSGVTERSLFARFENESGFTIGVKPFAEFEHPLLK